MAIGETNAYPPLNITPESIGAADKNHTHTPDEIGAEPAKISFSGIVIDTSSWISDSTLTDWPYKATITLNGVLSDMVADVYFGLEDSISGLFGPGSLYDGGIYLFANGIPTASITIDRIIVWR